MDTHSILEKYTRDLLADLTPAERKAKESEWKVEADKAMEAFTQKPLPNVIRLRAILKGDKFRPTFAPTLMRMLNHPDCIRAEGWLGLAPVGE